jgi:hypothetical protein
MRSINGRLRRCGAPHEMETGMTLVPSVFYGLFTEPTLGRVPRLPQDDEALQEPPVAARVSDEAVYGVQAVMKRLIHIGSCILVLGQIGCDRTADYQADGKAVSTRNDITQYRIPTSGAIEVVVGARLHPSRLHVDLSVVNRSAASVSVDVERITVTNSDGMRLEAATYGGTVTCSGRPVQGVVILPVGEECRWARAYSTVGVTDALVVRHDGVEQEGRQLPIVTMLHACRSDLPQ